MIGLVAILLSAPSAGPPPGILPKQVAWPIGKYLNCLSKPDEGPLPPDRASREAMVDRLLNSCRAVRRSVETETNNAIIRMISSGKRSEAMASVESILDTIDARARLTVVDREKVENADAAAFRACMKTQGRIKC